MILDKIIAYKKQHIEKQKQKKSVNELIASYSGKDTRDFKYALSKKGISIIGEIKKASPSKGIIRENFNPENIAELYEELGVDAISVLTEDKYFLGNDKYLSLAKSVTSKPVLRKDFIIDEYQIFESKAIGADAILLIVSTLNKDLSKYYSQAKQLGLNCLVEVHDMQELEIALNAGCDIIGINNRDLKTFNVDLKTTEMLKHHIPEGILVVSESGIKDSNDIKYLKELGIDAVLIGETFMKLIDDRENLKNYFALIKE